MASVSLESASNASSTSKRAVPEDTSSYGSQSPVEYLPYPPSAHPLDGLLPKGGIEQHPSWGYLKMPEKNLLNSHEVDFESREVRIHAYYFNTLSHDSADMWTAYYQELATYVFDMYDIGFERLWLNSLIGQKDGGSENHEGSQFDISIPVNMPAWMKDLGLDKPKLQLLGTMNIRLHGYGAYDDAPGSLKKSLVPSPSLTYEPSFLVKGKIGRNITVEVNNTQNGLGVQNSIKVVYAESTPGEFEDYIVQRIELGSTSLSLKGAELTGYSENHQGLFGVKTELKIGDWNVTAIASQDGGSTEKYTMRANEQSTEYQIQDKQFLAYRYYFLDHADRATYISHTIINGSPKPVTMPLNLTLYKRNPASATTNINYLSGMTAIYYDSVGAVLGTKTDLNLIPMATSDWSWDQRTGTIKVNGSSKSMLIAASWSNDPTGRKSSTVVNGDKVVLIQFDNTSADLPNIDKLMLRNVYSVGLTDASTTGFVLRMKATQSQLTGTYLKTLGLIDSVSNAVQVNDADIFPKVSSTYTGEMWLPCHPVSWYTAHGISQQIAEMRAPQNCLEPLRNLDTSSAMARVYNDPISNFSNVNSVFYFETVGKRRSSSISVRSPGSSYSVNSGNCVDIAPNSEQLKIGSDLLTRDVDYQVNYELGQIELISERALNPNNEISVTYECNPLFQIDNKMLIGMRAEHTIKSLNDRSLFGFTALYKSQSTTSSQPRFGGEPFYSVLLGANMSLQDSARWMDRFINSVPFIKTKARSQWAFQTEVAASFHNPNSSANKTALLDDFESSAQSLQYSMLRTYWTQASPPGGTLNDPLTYNELQDFKHAGQFIWHSNQSERYQNVFTAVGNTDVDTREMPILKFTLRPNDNLEGNSWGGVMRSNGTFYQKLSDYNYIEVVARGNVGNLYLDLGEISEDISINGYAPDGELESEAAPGSTVPLDDCGLDRICDKAGETRMEWDCRTPDCIGNKITSATSANPDIAQDDFRTEETNSDVTEPDVHVNGTENNNGSDERPYDTEDLNHNGTLDQDTRFVRYRVNLESEDPSEYEVLKNGWRRWRIPLAHFDTLVSKIGGSYRDILSNTLYSRLWYGNLKHGVNEGQAQIVELKIVGNQWLADSTKDQFGVVTDGPTQTVTVDGQTVTAAGQGQVLKADSNYLRVSVINNRDDANSYFISPNTKVERDANTSSPLQEQSMVLNYGNLHSGQVVSATRFFDTDMKDLTQYDSLKLEVHLSSTDSGQPIRFALQFGNGGQEGSDNFYEWSFKPTTLNMDACIADKGNRESDCHAQNWLANAMAVPLSEFVDLKAGRVNMADKEVARKGSTALARAERVRIVGNPTTGRINWVRFVIVGDDPTNKAPAQVHGVFWINDLRLSGVNTAWGYAGRVHAQLDFADVMSISGDAKYQDGNFATLKSDGKSPKPTMAEANTQLDVNGNYSLNINKFFKDEWMLHMPLSLAYTSTLKHPFLKPQSDVALTQDNITDILPEFLGSSKLPSDSVLIRMRNDSNATIKSQAYETFTHGRTLSFGYAKDHVESKNPFTELIKQALLERPAFNYRYSERESRSATSGDSSYSYGTTIDYKLGTFTPFNWHPIKKFTSLTFEPWPQTFDLTLFDLNYTKSVSQPLDPDYVTPPADMKRVLTYNVDLQHKVNMRWNMFPFLNTSYTLAIKRDMENGGDRSAFYGNNFFSTNSDGGLFAKNYIFDFDHTDRHVAAHVVDSVVTPSLTQHGDKKDPITGQVITYKPGDTNTYTTMYDRTYIYRVDSLGTHDFGKDYGILRDERQRSQDFKVNFTPLVIPFMITRFTFGSTFMQAKTIPSAFSFEDVSMIKKNYWSIDQTNHFEFDPTLKLIDLVGFGKKNAATAFLEKWKWRDIHGAWNVDLKTTGENFTFAQLAEQQHVSPLQYYLYGFGMSDGYGMRNPLNLVTGDMLLNTREDYERFAQYRNKTADTNVIQGTFTHSVDRRATAGTSLTLPWWDIAATIDGQWSETFMQQRLNPLFLDTTTVWPKVGVGISIPNFIAHVPSWKPYLKSISTSHRFDYTFTKTVHTFQNAEDEWKTEISTSPLIRVSVLTQRDLHIDNDVNVSYAYAMRRPKVQVITSDTMGLVNPTVGDTSDLYFDTPWMYTDKNETWSWTAGDELTLGYDIKTKHGFQWFRWYFRLKNDIQLKLNAGYSWAMEKYSQRAVLSGYSPLLSQASAGVNRTFSYACPELNADGSVYLLNGAQVASSCSATIYNPGFVDTANVQVPTRKYIFHIKPSVNYQFNKMVSSSAYLEYVYTREKMSLGGSHNLQTLQFEIALLMKFE